MNCDSPSMEKNDEQEKTHYRGVTYGFNTHSCAALGADEIAGTEPAKNKQTPCHRRHADPTDR